MDDIRYVREKGVTTLLNSMVRHLLLYRPQEGHIEDSLIGFLELTNAAAALQPPVQGEKAARGCAAPSGAAASQRGKSVRGPPEGSSAHAHAAVDGGGADQRSADTLRRERECADIAAWRARRDAARAVPHSGGLPGIQRVPRAHAVLVVGGGAAADLAAAVATLGNNNTARATRARPAAAAAKPGGKPNPSAQRAGPPPVGVPDPSVERPRPVDDASDAEAARAATAAECVATVMARAVRAAGGA